MMRFRCTTELLGLGRWHATPTIEWVCRSIGQLVVHWAVHAVLFEDSGKESLKIDQIYLL